MEITKNTILKRPLDHIEHVLRICYLFVVLFLLVTVSLSLGQDQKCGPYGCPAPTDTVKTSPAPQKDGSVPQVVPAQFYGLGQQATQPSATNQQTQKTAQTTQAIPQKLPVPAQSPASPPVKTGAANAKTPPQLEQPKERIFPELSEQSPPDDGSPLGSTQQITPEVTSQVQFSNSDINRIVCPVDIKDVVYSTEKGLTVKITDNNAFVKFLVMKKDGKELYSTTPSEMFIACGKNIYSVIAVPRRIPSQTIQLASGKRDAMEKNISLFSEVPFEKKIITIIKKVYTENIPDSFTEKRMNKPFRVFQDLDLVLYRVFTIEGEGLGIKEYRATIPSVAKTTSVYLKEKDFLRTELCQRPVAVSIDVLNLKKGETSRIFIVERAEGGQS